MDELNNKLKEAHRLADKELFKIYWNEKVFGISKKYWLIIGITTVFISCGVL